MTKPSSVPRAPFSGYAFVSLFLAGLLFVLLAPLFWVTAEFPQGMLRARAYENADLYQRVYPAFHFGFTTLRGDELPLWNPHQLCGAPFLADPASAVFQPLNAVFLLLPTERAMAVQAFLSLCLMGAFFVLFARSLDVRYIPAVLGGVVYAFCGASAAAMSQPGLAAALAWTPLLFWSLREYTRRYDTAPAIVGGIAAALIVLAGALPIFLVMLVLALPYVLLRILVPAYDAPGFPLGRRFRGLALMAGVAVTLSAVQWLPALAWFASLDAPLETLLHVELAGQRPEALRTLTAWFLVPPRDVLPHVGYLGVVTLVLLPATLFRRSGRPEVLFFLLATAVLFPLSLFTYVLGGVALPLELLAFPASFSVAALAALGADQVFLVGRDFRSPRLWAPSLLVLIATAVLLYLGTPLARGILLAAAALTLPFFVFRVRWIAAGSGLLLALLIYVDLLGAGANHFRHPFEDAATAYTLPKEAATLAEEQALDARVLANVRLLSEELSANIGMVAPLHAAGGVRIPLSKSQAQWWAGLADPEAAPQHDGAPLGVAPTATRPERLNYMAARVVLATPDLALGPERWDSERVRLRRAGAAGGLELYLNDTALSRTFWVPRWRVVPDTAAALDLLSSRDFDPRRECVVLSGGHAFDRLLETVPATAGEGEEHFADAASCAVTEEGPNRVVLEVTAPRPGVTVLADTYAPGWTATLNGESVPILTVNGLFRGIATPEGEHNITFEYRPLTFWCGMGISLAALIFLALAGLAAAVRRI